MAKGPRKFNLNSGSLLKNRLDYSVLCVFAEKHYYQSKSLKILIGLSKIFHAVVLLYLYLQRIPWSEKIPKTSFFVATSLLTYGIEYGISLVWWHHYFAKFENSKNGRKFIVCTWNPIYSGDYCIRIYEKSSLSFFQKLGTPVVDEKLQFADYFSESGYCLESKFNSKINSLLDQALYNKNK